MLSVAIGLLFVIETNATVLTSSDFERFLDLHNKANRIVRDFLESEEAIRRYSDDTHLAASICLERMRSDMMVLLQDSGELYLLALIGSEMVHPTDEERVVGVANIVIDTIKKDIANVRGLVNQHASGCPTISLVAAKAQQILSFMDEFARVVRSIADRIK